MPPDPWTTGEVKCDFCSSRPVKWRYPARDFVRRIPVGNNVLAATSEGDWAACDPCYRLIQKGDREGLARRSASTLRFNREERRRALPALRSFQDQFWSNREGAPIPYP